MPHTKTQPDMDKPSADRISPRHAADRLVQAIERVGSPVCVGLDPVIEKLPAALRPDPTKPRDIVQALSSFSMTVLDAIAEVVPCVKIQSACFERYRYLGVQALTNVIVGARTRGLQVILDAKRGDIGISAEHYAAAVFDELIIDGLDGRPCWVTINGYFGADGIKPFLREGFGAFVLVRTSNPSSDVLQASKLDDGRTVAERLATIVAELGETSIGECGFSALGAVVGATKSDEIAALRELMPQQIFLVPGFGAQGATVDDIRPCFNADGKGALITASRSVIYAFDPADPNWPQSITQAAKSFANQIASAI